MNFPTLKRGLAKLITVVLSALSFLFFIASCDNMGERKNDSPTNNSTASRSATDSTKAKYFAGHQFPLYNLALPKDTFLELWRNYSDEETKRKKYVVQFFFSNTMPNGSPTLAIWPIKKQSNDYDTPKFLLYYTKGNENIPDIPDEVYLGDQKIRKGVIKDIHTAIVNTPSCGAKCILLFSPQVYQKHVRYSIYLIEDSSVQSLSLLPPALLGETNPSPPAGQQD